MMMRQPKRLDMLSPEEREQFDTEEKERLSQQEIERIIKQEIKESFGRIGLEYQPGDGKPSMQFEIAFSQTAREYYKYKQPAIAELEASEQAGTGLGKTTYASRIAFSQGYLYLRLEATTTPKAFASKLLLALYKRFGMGEYIPYGTANDLFMMGITVLEDHKDTIIVVDEIDYAFRHPQLLGAIRDIVDVTTAIVILVGMQNAKYRLNQINEYYFDRCNFFYEFQDLPKKDIAQLCSEVLEIKFHPDIVDYVHFHSCGNVRKAMKLIRSVEETGRYRNLEVISQADLDD